MNPIINRRASAKTSELQATFTFTLSTDQLVELMTTYLTDCGAPSALLSLVERAAVAACERYADDPRGEESARLCRTFAARMGGIQEGTARWEDDFFGVK